MSTDRQKKELSKKKCISSAKIMARGQLIKIQLIRIQLIKIQNVID